MKIETKCLHSGYSPKNGEPRVVPIVQSTTYRFDSCDHVAELFDMVSKVELTHQRTLEHLANSLECKWLYKCNAGSEHAFKCDECGTIIKDRCAPKICPLCKMGQGYYRIDFSIS